MNCLIETCHSSRVDKRQGSFCMDLLSYFFGEVLDEALSRARYTNAEERNHVRMSGAVRANLVISVICSSAMLILAVWVGLESMNYLSLDARVMSLPTIVGAEYGLVKVSVPLGVGGFSISQVAIPLDQLPSLKEGSNLTVWVRDVEQNSEASSTINATFRMPLRLFMWWSSGMLILAIGYLIHSIWRYRVSRVQASSIR